MDNQLNLRVEENVLPISTHLYPSLCTTHHCITEAPSWPSMAGTNLALLWILQSFACTKVNFTPMYVTCIIYIYSIFTYMCMQVYVYVYVFVYVYVDMYMYTFTCIWYICMYLQYGYMYIYTFTLFYVHIHSYTIIYSAYQIISYYSYLFIYIYSLTVWSSSDWGPVCSWQQTVYERHSCASPPAWGLSNHLSLEATALPNPRWRLVGGSVLAQGMSYPH